MNQTPSPLPPFEIARVLSDALAVLRLAVKPLIILFACVELITGLTAIFSPRAWYGPLLFEAPIDIAAMVFAAGMSTRILYETAYGRSASMGEAFAETRRKFLFLFATGLCSGLGVMFGLALLIAPGLWLMGAWAVIVPLIIIEDEEYGALRRSFEMTDGYRWQAAGALAVGYAPLVIANFLLVPVLVGLGYGAMSFTAMVAMLSNALLAAIALSIHKRLTELKSGGDVDGISEVFR